MVLFIVGLGLGDEKDITVRGLEAVRSCEKIFLESYTSVLCVGKERLEQYYQKPIIIADRNMVESEAEQIYEPALTQNIALLVVGDPVCATTHTDIMIRAKEHGVKVELIHNASVMGAVGCCGLQLYNFGHTVSIPFFEDNWRPTSFYPKIQYNRRGGMHTLCLLDIKVKEPDFEAMARGRQVFLPPRFMSVPTAAAQLVEAEDTLGNGAYHADTSLCVGLARLGQPTQQIVAGTLQELQEVDFGEPLHSLIVCGELHELELEVLKEYLVEGSTFVMEDTGKEMEYEAKDGGAEDS
jgi:diphthine synthase